MALRTFNLPQSDAGNDRVQSYRTRHFREEPFENRSSQVTTPTCPSLPRSSHSLNVSSPVKRPGLRRIRGGSIGLRIPCNQQLLQQEEADCRRGVSG
ncbi:hypothetical protein E2C01_066487 [Portunus trituberculatus]|uniref:Uncharacterized protein n=1 Tax=Portunus trituberculatus TaxID=210409 RepID=A0A5B7HIA5_PORTR|nr:hypothetical protein [Portunus trituberculatus]